MILSTNFRALFVISLFFQKPGTGLTTCNKIVNVSGSYADDGCSLVSGNESVLRCDSLQAGLDRVSTTPQDDNCTEVVLSSGERYSIDIPVTINSSLVLRSSDRRQRAWVTVSAKRTPSPNYEPFYVLTVSGAKLVVIEGVEFSESPGLINIVGVSNAVVSHCSFRLERSVRFLCLLTSNVYCSFKGLTK